MPLLTNFSAPYRVTVRLGQRIGTAVLLTALVATSALADISQDATTLIKQEKHAQALEILDKGLAQKPADAQLRFLKGIALTELGKTDTAIAVFQKLTEEYPTLPEPYNNLAVIYAQLKQYDKAKTALEMAIRTHPAYATAHENLGDIYARLASQAYDKALQLDTSNAAAQHKLALIRDLVGAPKGGKPATSDSKPVQVAIAPPNTTPASAPLPMATTVENKPATQKPATPSVATAPTSPAAEPTKPSAKPTETNNKPEPTGDNKADSKAVRVAIEAWAAAWARKDVKGYLASYAKDFKVPGGKTRAAWEAERRQRIDKPGSIEVRVERLKISVDGDKAIAQFRQSYRSGKLEANAGKRLDLVRRDSRWLIVQESIGG